MLRIPIGIPVRFSYMNLLEQEIFNWNSYSYRNSCRKSELNRIRFWQIPIGNPIESNRMFSSCTVNVEQTFHIYTNE